jgi:hypothetical protein
MAPIKMIINSRHTEMTKQRIAIKQRGKVKSPATRAKQSAAQLKNKQVVVPGDYWLEVDYLGCIFPAFARVDGRRDVYLLFEGVAFKTTAAKVCTQQRIFVPCDSPRLI